MSYKRLLILKNAPPDNITVEAALGLSLGKSILQVGSESTETTVSLSIGKNITQNNISTFLGGVEVGSGYTLIQNNTGVFEAAFIQGILEHIEQAATTERLATVSLSHGSNIEQSGGIVYVGDITFSFSNNVSSISDISIEASTTFQIHTTIDGSGLYITSPSIGLNFGNSTEILATAIFNAEYLHEILTSVIQSGVIETDSDASISINIKLTDQYESLITLDTDTSLNIGNNISTLAGKLVEVSRSEGFSNSINTISDISIEGFTNIGIGVHTAQSAISIIESVVGIGVSLQDLISVNGQYFIDYVENLGQSVVGQVSQEFFEDASIGVSVHISSDGITTDFIVLAPNRRMLVSMDSDRIVTLFDLDRIVAPLGADRITVSPDSDRLVGLLSPNHGATTIK